MSIRLVYSFSHVLYSCGNIQIIALHDYNIDPSYIASHVDAAKPSAIASGKRLLYEEFGAEGGSKQSQTSAAINLLIKVSLACLESNALQPIHAFLDWSAMDVLGDHKAWIWQFQL